MLNITHNSIDRDKVLKDQSAYKEVMRSKASRRLVVLLSIIFFIGFLILFLPWTQNIRSRGTLTTLKPENREQSIHSMISGRVDKWYVREGQLVKKGDTIVNISEIKSEYLDPQLLERSGNQTRVKEESIDAYNEKVVALSNQIDALKRNKKLRLDQAQNYLKQSELKVQSDSIDYETAVIALDIAQKQFDRQQKLYDQGLKSLTELEGRRQKLQERVNKKTSILNKWLASKNELINAKISLSTVSNDYKEKIAKAESERMSAKSSALQAESDYNKLAIQQSSYQLRSGFYYITAPQDGYITKAMVNGIGETVKEGQAVFSFVPSNYELAAEIFIKPIDLPLISIGNSVQVQFDGWPALVFRGWPRMSFGTFSGEVVAFDKVADKNGNFRVLVSPKPGKAPWPRLLRLGSGVYGIALLKNVPVWYELWRQLNGFPPDFYRGDNEEKVQRKS